MLARPVGPQPAGGGNQHAAAEPDVGQVEHGAVKRHVDPVGDRAVQHSGRADQPVKEVTGGASGGERGTDPLEPTGRVACPEPEQDDASETRHRNERFQTGAETEGRAVIEH
jgi:hypothetical protein